MTFNKKNWIWLLVAGASTISCTQKENDAYVQPNIVLIMADDLGFSDLGCYGSEINTPNINYLGEQGIRFTQFTNCAKCFPSRASLLTGLYAQQCGMAQRADTLRNSITLAEVLRKKGYRTLMTGKHHGKENLYFRGFDHYYGLRDGACNYFNPGETLPGEPEPAHKTWAKPRHWCIDSVTLAPYSPKETDFYTTDYFTRYALDFLETYKNESNPFFLYVSYTAPHDPLQAWPEDIEKYAGYYREGYETVRLQRYKRMLEMGIIDESFPLSDPTYENLDSLSPFEKEEEIRRMQVYAAMIDRMDQNIGMIMNKLKEIGQYENTIIVFTSDNGGSPGIFPEDGIGYSQNAGIGEIGAIDRWASLGTSWSNVCNTPFRYYKTWSHHGGTSSPFIVYNPKRFNPQISQYPAHFIDIMPTFIEWTGAEYPKVFRGDTIPSLPGESFADVVTGVKANRETPMFWQLQNGKAVRKGDFRLVWESKTVITDPVQYAEGPDDKEGFWALYDMGNDKTETTDVSTQNPQMTNKLINLFRGWETQMSRYTQLEKEQIRR
jgi:arylsulfatase